MKIKQIAFIAGMVVLSVFALIGAAATAGYIGHRVVAGRNHGNAEWSPYTPDNFFEYLVRHSLPDRVGVTLTATESAQQEPQSQRSAGEQRYRDVKDGCPEWGVIRQMVRTGKSPDELPPPRNGSAGGHTR